MLPVPVETKDLKDQRVRLVCSATLDQWDHPVKRDIEDQLVCQGTQDVLVRRVKPAESDVVEGWEARDLVVLSETPAQWVNLDQLACQVSVAFQDQPASQACLENQALLEPQGAQEILVFKAHKAHVAIQVLRDPMVFLDQMASQGSQDHVVNLVPMDLQDQRVLQA